MSGKTFDLATLDTTALGDTGADMTVEHPSTGEALGIVITLAGRDSSTYRRAQDALARKMQTRRKPSFEDMRAEGVELLARCTLRWQGVVDGGEAIPCTVENARALYLKYPWLREQVDTFIADRGNYLRD